MADPEAPPAPDSPVAWSKVLGYLDKPIDGLHDLETRGSILEDSRLVGWKLSRIGKAADEPKATRGRDPP